MWVFAWVFHAVLALIFLGHFRVFTNADSLLMGLGMTEESIQAMSGGAGGVAGVVILLVSVMRERIFLHRRERYKEVQR